MNPLLRLAALAGAGAAATALLAAPAHATTERDGPHDAPVFVQNDDPNGNTIFAYDRTSTGRLVPAGSYATGGRGGVLTRSAAPPPPPQGALAHDKHSRLLYAVNAGSDTITTFARHRDTLVRRQILSS